MYAVIYISISLLLSHLNLPDPHLTPGVIRPELTAADICHTGTRDYRATLTQDAKRAAYARYGLEGGHDAACGEAGCTLDHLIPLELGGSNDVQNLWPQQSDSAVQKDRLENYLHAQVCKNNMPLAEAQHLIADNWQAAYQNYYAGGSAER